jgi:hypothetical protein
MLKERMQYLAIPFSGCMVQGKKKEWRIDREPAKVFLPDMPGKVLTLKSSEPDYLRMLKFPVINNKSWFLLAMMLYMR